MGNIVLLDELTINKIAAGEVIERPASVVKELVENSIDAGATNISVEIKNGGISYIRIVDNGKGILPDDMEIAFERHATSKIRQADDIEAVKSMGFRGEALASVAAIAKVEIVSKTKDSNTGYKIVVQGGKIIKKEEVGCPQGTTITVENLFYNTPVRYKFLKKDFTESGYIEDVMIRLSLINTNISFSLVNTGKNILRTSGNGELKDVVYSIYGKDIADNIININYFYDDMSITGVIGKPNISRSNRGNQLFFVNKRYIKDKILSSAAEQGFKGMLTTGKFGFLILNIDINPSKVDVNVHPAKLEVRFENEGEVFKLVYHAIKEALLKGSLFENTDSDLEEDEIGKSVINIEKQVMEQDNTKIINTVKERHHFSDIFKNKKEDFETIKFENNIVEEVYNKKIGIENIKTENSEQDKEEKELNDIKTNDVEYKTQEMTTEMKESYIPTIMGDNRLEDYKKESESDILEQKASFEEMYVKTFGAKPKNIGEIEEEQEEYVLDELGAKITNNISMFNEEKDSNKPKYKLIGVVFSTYIILEISNEMYILDQHAAHERILYEKVKKNYYDDNVKDSQLMLLPDIIELTHKEMDIAKDNMGLFEKAGFVLEEFGENTIKLTGVPNICIDLDTRELFLETLDEINTVARIAKQEIEEKFIATIACKAAVKANMNLSTQEIDNLLNELLLLQNPFTCPHGRPTAIKMSKTEIEKKFLRR